MMQNKYDSAEVVIAKLKKLIKKIEQATASFDSDLISRSQIRVILPIIKDNKGYSMQELSELGSIDKALVSRTITDLEQKNIVARDKEKDSTVRNYQIILTPYGKELFDSYRTKAKELSVEWLNGVSIEELAQFKNTLYKLTE